MADMLVQERAIFTGTPIEFVSVVKMFIEELEGDGRDAPYSLYPNPMPTDPMSVSCGFGPDQDRGAIKINRIPKGQSSVVVEVESKAWDSLRPWWLALRGYLEAYGWLISGSDLILRLASRG